MHGAMKGSPPAARTAATAARSTAGRSAMPRLPAVIATRAPRVTDMQTDALQPLAHLRGDVHDRPRGVQLVHELQKGPLVPHTVLSHVVGGIAAEPTTSHTNPKEA